MPAEGLAAVGAANSIATLFNTAVTWFDYLYVAKDAEDRLYSLLLKFDAAQLRLTRWGELVGLSGFKGHANNPEGFRSGSYDLTKDQEEKAEIAFRIISARFAKAVEICEKVRKDKKIKTEEIDAVEVPQSRLRWSVLNAYLHHAIKEVVSDRQPRKIPKLSKAKFAIYDEKHLKDLITDINEQIDSLYKTYPPPEEKQAKECNKEVEEITQVLSTLEDIVKGNDAVLGAAIQNILNQKLSFNYKTDRSNVLLQGQQTGGHNVQNNETHHGR